MKSRAGLFAVLLLVSLLIIRWQSITKSTEAKRTVWTLSAPYVTTALAFSPDSETLVGGEGSHPPTLKVWKWRTGILLHDIKTEHNAAITNVVFSADGRTITTCGADDNWLRVWDITSGKQTRARSSQTAMKSVPPVRAVSRNGSLVAFPRSGNIIIQDAKTYKNIRTLLTREAGFSALAFSPDEKWLAGSTTGKIYVWSVEAQP